MSASNELEPGPRSSGKLYARELVQGLSTQMKSLKIQAETRRVGWGGFTGG